MKISKLDHAALLVADVARSRHFYGEILGLEEISRPTSFTFPGAWFSTGGEQIHLIGEAEEGRTAQLHAAYRRDEMERGYGTHFAFAVDDLDAALQHVKSHGIEIVGGPRPRGDGVEQLYICDPDGYVIELFAWNGL